MCQKCDLFQAFLGAFPIYLGERGTGSNEKERQRMEKGSFRCHAILCERTDSPKTLGSVASFLRNSKFYRINDNSSSESRGSDAKEKTRKSVAESTQDSPVEQTSVWEAADEF